uniref:Crystaline entomocidal protoxin n=1 Tax=Bacillus thuringiensis TaxID=1428 RepID=Q6BE03_BACTU|nr:Cry protein [Bacillus thuringiensis]
MNQNYNNNGLEILDSGGVCSPRYPLANAPGSELQNMGYKEWLEMCSIKGAETFADKSTLSAQSQEGLRTAITIALSLLSNLPGPFGYPAKLLSIIFPFLWPTNTQAQWEAFMKVVEELVDQKIETFARDQAIQRLRGIQDVISLYQRDAKNFNDYPTSEPIQRQLLSQFTATNTFIVGSMSLFRVGRHEVPLLTTFVQAANLHLLLLRDAIMFGESWGMCPVTVAGYQNDFNNRIADYTDYSVSIYNQGLQKAKTLKANLRDYEKYPWARYYNSSVGPEFAYGDMENWNLYNNYRRDMTLMVLDLVALWPTYNPQQYPIAPKIQLTREIYTELRGNAGNTKRPSMDAIDAELIPPPRLFTWLESVDMHRWPTSAGYYYYTFQNAGIKHRYKYTLDSQTLTSSLRGASGNNFNLVPAEETINRVQNQHGEGLYTFSFYRSGQSDPFLNIGTTADKPYVSTMNRIPVEGDQTQANHRLSWITGMVIPELSIPAFGHYNPTYISCAAEGWTHLSVERSNEIKSDKITQIPAVKAFQLSNNASVVRGPGSTGGDLVQFSATSSGNKQLWIKVKPTTIALGRRFKVRIRYAAAANVTFTVQKCVTGVACWETATKSVTTTYSGTLTYNAFKYVDIFEIPANESEFSLEFLSTSGGPIYIDKIEFIPVNPIPEPPVPEGIYQIVTALNNSSVVDMDPGTWGTRHNVHLWQNNNTNNQKWRFVYNSSQGAYQIRNLADENLVLTREGANVKVVSYQNNNTAQYWIIEDAGNEYVYLKSKADPSRVLDVTGSSTQNGTNIQVWSNYGTLNQKFKLVKL